MALPAAMLSLGAPGPRGTLFSGPLTPPDSRPPDPRPFSRSPGPRLGRARSGHGAQLPSGGGGTPQRGDPPLQPPPPAAPEGSPPLQETGFPPSVARLLSGSLAVTRGSLSVGAALGSLLAEGSCRGRPLGLRASAPSAFSPGILGPLGPCGLGLGRQGG